MGLPIPTLCLSAVCVEFCWQIISETTGSIVVKFYTDCPENGGLTLQYIIYGGFGSPNKKNKKILYDVNYEKNVIL